MRGLFAKVKVDYYFFARLCEYRVVEITYSKGNYNVSKLQI